MLTRFLSEYQLHLYTERSSISFIQFYTFSLFLSLKSNEYSLDIGPLFMVPKPAVGGTHVHEKPSKISGKKST